MATRKPKRTAELGQKLDEKLRGKGVKVKHYNVTKVGNTPYHTRTDGRSSMGAMNQNYQDGRYTADSTTSKGGKLAVAKRDENGRLIGTDTKNAKTNLFTPKNDDGTAVLDSKGNKRQSGTRKGENGRMTSEANRRQRDYYVRVGLNNDKRSPEALARLEATLRANGASEDEITALTGRGNGNPAPWRAVSTG